MKSSTLESIAVLFTFVGALGTIVFSCISMKGGMKHLSILDRVIMGALGMVVLLLILGNRVFSWWPRLFPEMAEALMFCFMGFIYYRNWRRNRLVVPQ